MDLYSQIEQAIRRHEKSLPIGKEVKEEDVRYAVRWVMRDHPDIFWFVHQYFLHQDSQGQNHVLFRYRLSEGRAALIQKSIDEVVERDFQIAEVRKLATKEQVAYVYKWLLAYCNYNLNSAFNQNIDSVFVRRNSVCTGYAKAAQYLFQLLGIESRIVFGRLNNDTEEGRHCWNMVQIEDRWYHYDVCLGDVALRSVLENTGVKDVLRIGRFNYPCFCVSTAEISKTRSIEDIETLPPCNDNLSAEEITRLARVEVRRRSGEVGCLLTQIGSSSDIHLCTKDKNVVLKIFRGGAKWKCEEEYGYMTRLAGCPHLIQLNERYTHINDCVLAIEQSTPILDLFYSHYYHPTLRDVLTMIRDITLAWMECQERGVLHRDIHICNIYKANNGVYKLGDFGSCVNIPNRVHERVGSLWFMSPETYSDGVFDERSAVYSITTVLYFILNGLQSPFQNGNNEDVALQKKMSGEELPVPSLLQSFPDVVVHAMMRKLIVRGCAFDPKERMSSCKRLLSEVEKLLSILNMHNLKLHFYQNDPNLWFETKTDRVPIKRDAHHKSAYGEELERMALTDHSQMYRRGVNYSQREPPAPPVPPANSSSLNIYEETERDCSTMSASVSTLSIEQESSSVTYEPSVRDRNESPAHDKNEPSVNNRTAPSDSAEKMKSPQKKSLWSRFFHRAPKTYEVYASVFAPSEVCRKSHMLIQVYLHLFNETDKVIALSKESQKEAERRDYSPLQCRLKKGDRVSVQLSVYGDTLLKSERKSMVWQGVFTKCSFDYFVPADLDAFDLSCMATLSVNGIPIGELSFVTKIAFASSQLNPEVIVRKYRKVFISYSHKDEDKVKSFHEGLRLFGIDHFFDRAYLKAGDIYPKVIRDYIDSADLFVLFLSANASESEYMLKEREQALKRAFPQVKPAEAAKLSIYPVIITPVAEVPDDMQKNYHFMQL